MAISAVFDLVSFRQSAGQLIGRARRHHQDLMDEARGTSDPTLRAVFVEDAVLIGLVLIRASLRLGKRGHDFLLGYPGVTAIHEVLVTFSGPGRVWITARLDIDDQLTGAQVTSLVRGIESGMKREPEAVYRVDVVPADGPSA